MEFIFKKIYNFIKGLSSEVSILLLALGVGYTTDSFVNALISYYLFLLFSFLFKVLASPTPLKKNVSLWGINKKNELSYSYFVFCVMLAIPIFFIPDGNLEITTKVAWYFGAIVLYRFIMQTLLVLGFSRSETAVYLRPFIVGAFLLIFPLLFLGMYNA